MYDITNEETFHHLSYWLSSIDKVSALNISIKFVSIYDVATGEFNIEAKAPSFPVGFKKIQFDVDIEQLSLSVNEH